MFDHDREVMPLYNALPRLVDITLREYERFIKENSRDVIEDDGLFVDFLRNWHDTVRRYPVPAGVQGALDAHSKSAVPRPDDDFLTSVSKRLRAFVLRS
jgi:hypothetical protein